MTVPRYRLTGRLESGELAELFEAVRDDGLPVAVKLFHPRTSDPGYARQIAETSRTLSTVESETIVRVLDVGIVQDRVAIVREHVDGFTLGQALQRLITREVLMSPALALYVVIQLLEATQQAHDTGVVHGAITPGNVLLGKDGRTGLTDFGALAALISVPELRAFASRGRGAYRAPEVVQGESATAGSDVYSLGAIAYELLTLREAARSSKTVSTRHEPLPPPSRLDRRINARLDPIVMRAIEPHPQRRFKSCAEMANALRNFLSASGGMPSHPELARMVGELFPNELQVQPSPQIPFAEEFSLSEVTGAGLPPRPSPARSEVLTARPSFSGGAIPAVLDLPGSSAETIEAMPAFAPYPEHDEGTAPGTAGPLEHGWEAPPGAAPTKRPLSAGPAAAPPMSAALKGRFRVVEDFGPSDGVTPEPEAAPTAMRPRPQRRTPPAPAPPVESREAAEAPADPAVSQDRPMVTAERKLVEAAVKRRRFLAVAVAVACVGVFCFVLVVWRYHRSDAPPPTTNPGAPQSGDSLAAPSPSGDPAPAAPAQTPAARLAPASADGAGPVMITAEDPPKAAAHEPSRANVAYLSISSNVPAAVYVDGRKVAKRTPLRRFKVAPGERTIVLRSLRTKERRQWTANFERGKERKFYEKFQTRSR